MTGVALDLFHDMHSIANGDKHDVPIVQPRRLKVGGGLGPHGQLVALESGIFHEHQARCASR